MDKPQQASVWVVEVNGVPRSVVAPGEGFDAAREVLDYAITNHLAKYNDVCGSLLIRRVHSAEVYGL